MKICTVSLSKHFLHIGFFIIAGTGLVNWNALKGEKNLDFGVLFFTAFRECLYFKVLCMEQRWVDSHNACILFYL